MPFHVEFSAAPGRHVEIIQRCLEKPSIWTWMLGGNPETLAYGTGCYVPTAASEKSDGGVQFGGKTV